MENVNFSASQLSKLRDKMYHAANQTGEIDSMSHAYAEINHEVISIQVDIVNYMNGHLTEENAWLIPA